MTGMRFRFLGSVTAIGLAAGLSLPALAAQPGPQAAASPAAVAQPAPSATPTPAPSASAAAPAAPVALAPPVDLDAPLVAPVMHWPLEDAKALLSVIRGIGTEGLIPADYKPADLKAAIAAGEGEALDKVASTSFAWLVEDLRDGRTPMNARLQWFAFDKDRDVYPTEKVMAAALESHDIAGALFALDPTYPDYAQLRDALAQTPAAQVKTRALIRANMDRWRWFSRDLGEAYLMTNVPEFELRLVRRDKIVRTYRTIVGKPGKTATPQLSEIVQGVIFNPTWTVPQSIVVGEGLGARLIKSPAKAKLEGYAVTKLADGTINVVQQPGPNNSLGLVKLDMPNAHAIFLHDTPSRQLFNQDFRALSHGCVRTERAKELAIALTIIGGGKTADEAAEISDSRKYTKVPMVKTLPIYIGYFTFATSIDGQFKAFTDLYGRDAPLLASFNQPRELKTNRRMIQEKVVAIDKPGV